MTNINNKNKDERKIARLLLCEMGYEPDIAMSGESPDLVIPSRTDGTIGVEVSKYLDPKDSEDLSCFQNILDEYAICFDKKKMDSNLYDNNIPYDITVFMHGASAPKIKACKQKKNKIFDELDNCLFPIQDYFYEREFIASVTPRPTNNIAASKLSVSFIEPFSNVNENILKERIKEKETKLRYYKTLPKNSRIKEYYLLIYIPVLYQIDIRNYIPSCNIISDYDHIYLTNDGQLTQIK